MRGCVNALDTESVKLGFGGPGEREEREYLGVCGGKGKWNIGGLGMGMVGPVHCGMGWELEPNVPRRLTKEKTRCYRALGVNPRVLRATSWGSLFYRNCGFERSF
jgi:hypothetical protein